MNELTCPRCGKNQGEPTADCRSCGIVFAKYQAPPPDRLLPHVSTPPRRRVWPKVLAVLVVGAVLIGGLGYAGFSSFFEKMRSGPSYQVALASVLEDEVVLARLGVDSADDVQVSELVSFFVNKSRSGGSGDYQFQLSSADQAKAGARVALRQNLRGEWEVTDGVYFDARGEVRFHPDPIQLPEPKGPPEGLTAAELLERDVESFGEASPPIPLPPGAIAEQAAAQKTEQASTQPAKEARRCPYTGSTSRYVRTIRSRSLYNEVKRSAGCLTLVSVWGAWCPTCRDHYPSVVELADKYRESGLAFHSFATDEDPDALDTFLDAQPSTTGTFRVLPWEKGEFGKGVAAFGGTYPGSVPYFVLFDRDGKVLVEGTTNAFPYLEKHIKHQI